jgi:hypothetical protein
VVPVRRRTDRKRGTSFDWSLTDEESQLSVWAEEASTLLISTDLTTLTPAELTAPKNPDIIAVWRSETTSFSGIHITLPAGGTETLVIKPVSQGG